MLKRVNRLKKPVRSGGKSFSSKNFILRSAKNSEEVVRAGFIISKKTAKKAVERNRAKRIFREEMRLLLSRIKGGVDLTFIIKNRSVFENKEGIRKEIEEAIKKEGLLK
ncbi:MAG: ribonuclease P protein component [Candidatus Levybacteria bacterium]|nr:ribonuclease P protein component [Candidatus Levybacteria bacterium]